eukprot:gene4275-4112_t
MAIQRLDEQLSEQKAQTEKAIKEYESINKTTQRYQRDLEQEIERTSSVKAINSHLQGQLKDKEVDIQRQKQEKTKQTRQRDTAVKGG